MATQTKIFDLLKAEALEPITADLEASVGGLVAAAVAEVALTPGPAGADGATGPAPAGTGYLRVTAGVLDTPSDSVSALLSSYTIPITVLTPVAGAVAVTLNGGVYTLSPTANVTSWTVTHPAAGQMGSCTIYVLQPATPVSVALPVARTDGYSTPLVETTAGSITIIELWNNPLLADTLEIRTSISAAP